METKPDAVLLQPAATLAAAIIARQSSVQSAAPSPEAAVQLYLEVLAELQKQIPRGQSGLYA